MAITTDSAGNNGTLIKNLEGMSHSWVRCMAHALNRAVQDFLDSMKASAISAKKLANYMEAAQKGELTQDDEMVVSFLKLRHIIIKMRLSKPVKHDFKNCCGKLGCKYLHPCLDCKTRWNSTYAMLKFCLSCREAIELACVTNKVLQKYALSLNEWEQLITVCDFLKVFPHSPLLIALDIR
jgi:hypothetical protein